MKEHLLGSDEEEFKTDASIIQQPEEDLLAQS